MEKPYLKVILGLYIKNAKGLGPRSENWTINDEGTASLSDVLLSTCQGIINLATVIMTEDEIVGQVKATCAVLSGIHFKDGGS